MRNQLDFLAKSSKEYADEQSMISLAAGKEKAAVLLAKNQAAKKVRFFRSINQFGWVYYVIAGIFLLYGFAVWAYEIEPVYSWVISILPDKMKNSAELFGLAWTVISAAFALLMGGIKMFFSSLGSSEREQQLYDRFYQRNMDAVKED